MNIKDVDIGRGKTKIVVSFVGRNKQELQSELNTALNDQSMYDIVEIRADHFDALSQEEHIEIVQLVADTLKNVPVLYTYRTTGEGGSGSKSAAEYESLLETIIAKCNIDLIDIEFFMYEDIVKNLINRAKEKGIIVVLSNHDFKYTPHFDEIMATYENMIEAGGDILKLAYYPNDGRDVLSMLSAVHDAKQKYDCKIVGISLGEQGKITRLAGGIFGSCLTFGYLKEDVAPGQIQAKLLKENLKIFE